MKISVIIPVKNRALLLSKTLNNLFTQSLKAFEIIVVDDGSEDNLDAVLKNYQNDIIYLKSEGMGPGAARNTGLRRASGNFIQFFDSDDLMTKDKLEIQANLLQNHSADFVYGPYVRATEEAGHWKRLDAIMQYYPLPKKHLTDLVLEGWCLLTQSALFRKDFLEKVGFWRTDLMPHEDREYWFRIAGLSKGYIHENQTCVFYRQHGNQITDKAIVNKERSLDGIKSTTIINRNRKKPNSLHSLVMFFGQLGYAKKYHNKVFANEGHLIISPKESLASYYYALISKLERRITQTGWMRMHGALRSEDVFQEYLKKLN